MQFFLKILSIFALLLVLSCSQRPAKIVNRSRVVYDKSSVLNKEKYNRTTHDSRTSNHEIEVGPGDTLYSLSKKHQVTLRDLIKQNNLSAPYNLKNGEHLIIPSPSYHEVKNGETLYGISRMYNMKVDQLIEMNDLREPYSVKVGEKIRIAKFTEEPARRQVENKKITQVEEKNDEPNFVEKTLDRLNHFSWPVRGVVVSKFGPKKGGLYNDGINIAAKEGEAVKASEDGVVAYVGNELKGYGNLVIVKHSGGWITAYAHLKESLVKRGTKVEKGQKIGLVGATGNVTSPQLYFGLRKGRDAVNPENYLKS